MSLSSLSLSSLTLDKREQIFQRALSGERVGLSKEDPLFTDEHYTVFFDNLNRNHNEKYFLFSIFMPNFLPSSYGQLKRIPKKTKEFTMGGMYQTQCDELFLVVNDAITEHNSNLLKISFSMLHLQTKSFLCFVENLPKFQNLEGSK